MTSGEPPGIHFKTIAYDPTAPHPFYMEQAHATAVAGHAIEWLLTDQMNACTRKADTMKFPALIPASAGPDIETIEAFARSMLALMGMAWTDLTMKRYMKASDPENVLRGALVLPFWAASMPRIGELAVQHRIPILTAMWTGYDFEHPPETPSGAVLAVGSKNHMAPSLALQNYTVEAVYPFTTPKADA